MHNPVLPINRLAYGVIDTHFRLKTIKPTNEYVRDLGHKRFEVNGMRLADDPVSVATQRPTSDGPNQSFLV